MKNRISICSSLLALALLALASVSGQAQAFNPIRITGLVTDFKPADCGKSGSITIAGVTFPIAAGVEVSFVNLMPRIDSSGGISDSNAFSEVWQVVGTVRQLSAYLDPKGNVRLQLNATANVSRPGAATPGLDVTGVVTGASPLTINGYTFNLSSASLPAVVAPTPVRITGTLNSANELTITSVVAPYRKLTVCGAPSLFNSSSVGIVTDTNAFDADGPIAGISTNAVFPNPLGTTGSQFVCDQSIEVLTVNDGSGAIRFAPNFTMRQDISQNVPACFEFQIDQFTWATNGSKKIGGTGKTNVSGILEARTLATTSFPTNNNEAAQRGSIVISGITFTVASGVTVDLPDGVPTLLDPAGVCLLPVIDVSGQTAPFLTGQQAPPRAGQLIKGSILKKGLCP